MKLSLPTTGSALKFAAYGALLAASLVFADCNKNSNDADPNPTLYTRLGGQAAIASVVDTFLVEVLADTVINARFNTLPSPRVTALRQNLIDQICAGSGGPCTYMGKSMLAAHSGKNISQAEFNALVGDLVTSLDKHHVPATEKNDLLAILGPMQTDIVGK
ncbi:MAG TPA: group 1 truncated hemoglobin [Fibrobacteria bacterium]|nr:group 1 truncated hemoglobin [Fibrobacteria bacterium]